MSLKGTIMVKLGWLLPAPCSSMSDGGAARGRDGGNGSKYNKLI